MRFFTPELYHRFNSENEAVADKADEMWDRNVQTYALHLKKLVNAAPALKRLAELELHDAEVLSFEQFPSEALEFEGTAVLSVSFTDQVYTLIYQVAAKATVSRAQRNWPFSEKRTHWLYDEIDARPERRREFIHRVLLSDSRVLVITFVSAIVHTLTIAGTTCARRIA